MKTPRQLKSSEVPSLRKHILEKKQNGKCWICGKVPKIACLDHHHKKRIKGDGLIRGVLCNSCNVFLAKSENNASRYGISSVDLPTILEKMAKYLRKPHYPYLHPSEADKPTKLGKRSFTKLLKLWKQKYPNKKDITYPKSGNLTIALDRIYKEFKIQPEFLSK